MTDPEPVLGHDRQRAGSVDRRQRGHPSTRVVLRPDLAAPLMGESTIIVTLDAVPPRRR